MDNAEKIQEGTKGFGKNQTLILRALYLSPQPVKQFSSVKDTVLNLQDRGLIKLEDNQVFLTSLGQAVCESWQEQKDDQSSRLPELDSEGRKELPKLSKSKQAKLEKSNQFLELYKQGLNRQQIGDQYGISRERVRQILNINPAFHEYLKECEEAEASAEEEKRESAKQELYSRSLAALYPERVAELWDCERNGDLKPEDVPAGTTQQDIWFRCPIDGYSWKKKPSEIVRQSWDRNGTSGCPACAGKKKKAEKQPTLTGVYPELTRLYWDYEKNNQSNLDAAKLTLASNRKVWFKCPHDGNEWEARITTTVNQQWSKGNAGCRVCNGTAERKQGEWQRRDSIVVEFPEEVAKYWFYEANNELGLDPTKMTIGSRKEAFFKCPTDGHQWVAPLSQIKSSWKKGNSGCPACRGFVAIESTSLIAAYPDYVAQYWDYQKNNELSIYPEKFTRGSQQEAWFKCPHDGYEWKTRIGSITKGSWNLGNNGCARCFGWNIEAIRQFVASLESHIPNLTQAELYKIFEQSGVLDTKNIEGLKLVKDIIRGKLRGQKLRDVIQGKEAKVSETEVNSVDVLKADTELQIVDSIPSLSISEASQTFETTNDSQEQLNELNELPKVKVRKSLEFLSSKIVASADQEAIDFFIASRRNRIWAEVFKDESAVEAIEAFTDEGYGRQVRDQFLDEYNQARDMTIPSGWAFRVDGKVTPPNLMQKLAAVHLRSQQRMLNLSLTGTGKTIGGILSSRIINAHLTIIICPLDTVQNWHGEIKHVFPDSRVTIKNFNPHWIDIEEGHHYVLLNHEMFQQPSTPAHIRQLLERYQIDFIIVDEIHRCKQRGDDPSKRRRMVLALITNAAEKNPNLHVLGMSATPVINNLKEGKSLVELVTGREHSDLGEKATLNNCMRLHQAFVTLGIRSKVKPEIDINKVRIPVDCTHLVDKIREEGTSILKMEQILTHARIPAILKEIRPKTIVYTHYVEGIIDQLKEAIEAEGWTVGFHIGGDKSGRNTFIDGSVDVLIASSAMATGVDGFQRVCDRLILNIPPWTSAELEQLEGRLNRQGQVHDTLTILMPVTYGLDDGEHWSWDEGRLARLQNKQTVADAAVDGVMPEGQLRTESQAFRDLRKWLERLKIGEQKSIIRPRIFVPLPDADPIDSQRRNVQYGDFSRMNARWNSSYSHTTYERLQGNPEEWMQYHTLYQEARKTWTVIPYEEAIKWLQKRSDLVVADFGCGEALIAKALVGRHTVHSFDFIAINNSVIECDVARVPLEDNCLDVAMFNLSLMGLNTTDYIREAARTLKLDGQLWIYEVTSHFKDLQGFVRGLKLAGFKIIENTEIWKFRYIRAIKSEEVDLSQMKVQL
ncbi:DEAD/DEAH box helicase family protein (plasmid) [Phormidium sp. CLA17]|uniref:zinc-ribbon domain-containing protein n=1 Tax=Leptolyngbya sp. Cla-17 TaxID=2803751 RepID=UPI00149163E8|nr:zinc-ribbon domain-containing protein [Leptolyngbya sp. Cla-17]MBM0745382.1 DEAD/DEAH box helicase family protein [Leptolyngbya sp. Cla-17]